jgi:hypothetical protein
MCRRIVQQHPTIKQAHGMLHKRPVLSLNAFAKTADHAPRGHILVLK